MGEKDRGTIVPGEFCKNSRGPRRDGCSNCLPRYHRTTSSGTSFSFPHPLCNGSSGISSASAQLPSETSISDMVSVMREMRDLVSTLSVQLSSRSSTPLNTVPPDQPEIRFVPSDTVPHINTVDDNTKSKIHAGKYINLASLLLPAQESGDYRLADELTGTSCKTYKPDPRLQRNLNFAEFTRAFKTYKDVFCEAWPNRRSQLDQHEHTVGELFNLYGGYVHYEYHKHFAARVAALAERGIHIDWGIPDTKIYMTCTSGRRCRSCEQCGMLSHDTATCPSLAVQDTDTMSTTNQTVRRTNTDSYGRLRIRHQGQELCNNFNGDGCLRPRCNFLHICASCFGKGHSKSDCKKAKHPHDKRLPTDRK